MQGDTADFAHRPPDQLVGVFRAGHVFGVHGPYSLQPHRLVVVEARHPESPRQAHLRQQQHMLQPFRIFRFFAHRRVHVQAVGPGFGQAHGGETAGRHVPEKPAHPFPGFGSAQGLHHFGPFQPPPFDHILRAHVPASAHPRFGQLVQIPVVVQLVQAGAAPVQGVAGVLFDVGQMGNRVPDVPALRRGFQRPVANVDLLQELVQVLLFRHQIGKYLPHGAILQVWRITNNLAGADGGRTRRGVWAGYERGRGSGPV